MQNLHTNTDCFITDRPKNFDLSQIFDCGQCFRFNRSESDQNTYEGIAFSKFLKISQDDKKIYFHGIPEAEYTQIWKDFFDTDRDYQAIIDGFCDDNSLFTAAKTYSGIRILKQDMWETLCSFIISQNNNIPRIKGIIENMSKTYGEPVLCFDGTTRYAFPTAKALYEAGEKEIFALKTGFRAKYIFDAAQKVVSGEINLDDISKKQTQDASYELCKIKGVGPKVAACTLLFGFQKLDAFPIDVWVKKILAKYYSDSPSKHFSSQYAGIAQQYLFYYERCINGVYL